MREREVNKHVGEGDGTVTMREREVTEHVGEEEGTVTMREREFNSHNGEEDETVTMKERDSFMNRQTEVDRHDGEVNGLNDKPEQKRLND